MEKSEFIKILRIDESLIDEALRRLMDGTCCLNSDNREFIQELFDKVIQAIKEHIAIEENVFLPQVDFNGASLMLAEHKKMMELLDESRHALNSQRAVTFKVLLQALKNALKGHEEVENHLFESLNELNVDQGVILAIQKRIEARVV